MMAEASPLIRTLARISRQIFAAEADPGMSALRSIGLLDVLSSTPAGPSVALAEMRQMRLVSMPVCASSLRNLVRNAGSGTEVFLSNPIASYNANIFKLEESGERQYRATLRSRRKEERDALANEQGKLQY
jgi:hypothetical protein